MTYGFRAVMVEGVAEGARVSPFALYPSEGRGLPLVRPLYPTNLVQ